MKTKPIKVKVRKNKVHKESDWAKLLMYGDKLPTDYERRILK